MTEAQEYVNRVEERDRLGLIDRTRSVLRERGQARDLGTIHFESSKTTRPDVSRSDRINNQLPL